MIELESYELLGGDPSSLESHLADRVVEQLVLASVSGDDTPSIVCHLRECSMCRNELAVRLKQIGASPGHPAVKLLEAAEEWGRMAIAGRAATIAARKAMHARGILPVYKAGGVLVEELPDGRTRPLKQESVVSGDGEHVRESCQ